MLESGHTHKTHGKAQGSLLPHDARIRDSQGPVAEEHARLAHLTKLAL
jgi:hypothetical protein